MQGSFDKLNASGEGDTATMLSLYNATQQVSILLKKPQRIAPSTALPYINRALSEDAPEVARDALGCLELMVDRDRTTAPQIAATCSQNLVGLLDSQDSDIRREALTLTSVMVPLGDSAVHFARAGVLRHVTGLLRLTDEADEVLLAFSTIMSLLVCCAAAAQLLRDSEDAPIQLLSFFANSHSSTEVRTKAVAILQELSKHDTQSSATQRLQAHWSAQDTAKDVIQRYVSSSEES
jgi:hypothetical protein